MIKVHVLEKHIEAGKDNLKCGEILSSLCPIALALRDQTGIIWRVSPDYANKTCYASDGEDLGYKIKLSRSVVRNVRYFDYNEHHKVQPFTFLFDYSHND